MDTDNLSDDSELSSLLSLSDGRSSSPLSWLPNSPEIPTNFISATPPPSQDAGDELPPARKRRKIDHTSRTTQILDLTSDPAQSEYDREQATESLLHALRKRRKIVVVAGAGISVSAGIPDFRSSHGLFKSLRGDHKLKGSGKQLFDASVYKDDSSTSHFHDMVRQLSKMADDAQPTPFHRLIARLSAEGRLLRLYTQNVDGLDTALSPLETRVPLTRIDGQWPKTIQLHGGLEKMMCQKCRRVSDFDAKLFEGPVPPPCPQCVEDDNTRTNIAGKRSHGIGRLRPRIVLYNEHNPDDEAIGSVTAFDCRTRPDAILVVGTSMKIPGVRRIVSQMCRIVRGRREGTAIWINRDGVPSGKDLEDCWDVVVKGDSDQVARLANLREWDDPAVDSVEEYTDSDVDRVKVSQGVLSINIPPSPVKAQLPTTTVSEKFTTAVLTPPQSRDGDETEKVTFKPKSTPLKLTLKMSVDKTSDHAPMTNPASLGRKLSDVLANKENKRKPGRPKNSLNKKKSETSKAMKVTTGQTKIRAKITKVQAAAVLDTKAQMKHKPLSPRRDSELNAEHPSLVSREHSSFGLSPVRESPSAIQCVSPLPTWNRAGTISPTGSIPKDMVKLLN